jgi:hypothetical protein
MRRWERWLCWVAVAGALMLNNPNIAKRGPLSIPAATTLAEAAGINPALRTASELGAPSTIFNPFAVRVSLTTTQSGLLSGADTKILFDTLLAGDDPKAMWSTANHNITIPLTGRYYIAVYAAVGETASPAGSFYGTTVKLFRNGGAIRFFSQIVAAPPGAGIGTTWLPIADAPVLNQGDIIDARALYSGSLTGFVLGGASNQVTWMTMHLLSQTY